jgi:hypothetical protein
MLLLERFNSIALWEIERAAKLVWCGPLHDVAVLGPPYGYLFEGTHVAKEPAGVLPAAPPPANEPAAVRRAGTRR